MSTMAGTRISATRAPVRVPLVALGMSLSLFLLISYLLCVALGLLAPDWGLHRPWLEFLPGFTWLTWPSFFLGAVESFVFGWYIALVFAPLYNFFTARGRS